MQIAKTKGLSSPAFATKLQRATKSSTPECDFVACYKVAQWDFVANTGVDGVLQSCMRLCSMLQCSKVAIMSTE